MESGPAFLLPEGASPRPSQPEDRCKAVLAALSLLGVACLFSWNAIITPYAYYQLRFASSAFRDSFESLLSVTFTGVGLVTLLVFQKVQHRLTLSAAIVASLVVSLTVFAALAVYSLLPLLQPAGALRSAIDAEATASFVVTLLCTAVAAVAQGFLTSAVVSYSAVFPPRCARCPPAQAPPRTAALCAQAQARAPQRTSALCAQAKARAPQRTSSAQAALRAQAPYSTDFTPQLNTRRSDSDNSRNGSRYTQAVSSGMALSGVAVSIAGLATTLPDASAPSADGDAEVQSPRAVPTHTAWHKALLSNHPHSVRTHYRPPRLIRAFGQRRCRGVRSGAISTHSTQPRTSRKLRM